MYICTYIYIYILYTYVYKEVPAFIDHGLHVFQKIRLAGDLLGGSGHRQLPGYVALSFVRNALVAQIAARLPGALDKFSMRKVVGVLSSSAVSALSRRSPRYIAAVVIYTSSFSALSRRCFCCVFRTSISPVSHHWYPAIISPALLTIIIISPVLLQCISRFRRYLNIIPFRQYPTSISP